MPKLSRRGLIRAYSIVHRQRDALLGLLEHALDCKAENCSTCADGRKVIETAKGLESVPPPADDNEG